MEKFRGVVDFRLCLSGFYFTLKKLLKIRINKTTINEVPNQFGNFMVRPVLIDLHLALQSIHCFEKLILKL